MPRSGRMTLPCSWLFASAAEEVGELAFGSHNFLLLGRRKKGKVPKIQTRNGSLGLRRCCCKESL